MSTYGCMIHLKRFYFNFISVDLFQRWEISYFLKIDNLFYVFSDNFSWSMLMLIKMMPDSKASYLRLNELHKQFAYGLIKEIENNLDFEM